MSQIIEQFFRPIKPFKKEELKKTEEVKKATTQPEKIPVNPQLQAWMKKNAQKGR